MASLLILKLLTIKFGLIGSLKFATHINKRQIKLLSLVILLMLTINKMLQTLFVDPDLTFS